MMINLFKPKDFKILQESLVVASEELVTLREKNGQQFDIIKRLEDRNDDERAFSRQAKKDLKAAQKIIREQTEADILINALKAVGIIPEKVKTDYREREAQLLERLQGLGALSGQAYNENARQWGSNLFGRIC